ncbi:DNA repair/transcription protein MET18/MMS19, partial [Tremellales sp. Uapishka_1]
MDLARLIRTQITASELDPPLDLVQSINDGQTALAEIVKAMGEYLTSTKDDVRLKGLTFLTNLLGKIGATRVNRQAARTLTTFYVSKLDDFDSLPPALTALTILSKLPTFDDDAAVDVYKGVVENVNMKAYVQSTRHLVYVLFDSLLASHRKAFRAMGAEFLNSYTKMVDGEKDPRNLLLLFSMARVILLEFEVEPMIEDFYDITFCYFPITFKPPPNDPYGITADDLKVALRSCMSASPFFAKMALPLFLEKFATATGPSMRDLMLSMAACFPVYGAQAVGERGTELWEGIKTEIMYSSEQSTEAAALSALEALMRALYPTENDPPIGLAQEVIKECLAILQEPEKSQGISATKALCALVRGSPSAGKFAVSQTLPQLFRQFNSPALPSHRTPILSAITSIILACRSVYGNPESRRNHYDEKGLENYRDGLMDVLREGLRTGRLKAPAIRGCVGLTEIPGFWGKEEVGEVVKGMNDVLVNDEDPEIRPVVINALTSISKIHPSIIESITLPLLFHNLPDAAPTVTETLQRDKYRSILASLSKLCIQPALFETLLIRITTKLDLLSSRPASEEEVAYAYDLLRCLEGVVEKKLEEKHTDVVKYFEQLVPRLWGLSIVHQEGIFRDRRVVGIIGRIGERLIWELSTEKQSKLWSALYNAFEKGQLEEIVYDKSSIRTALHGSPLRNGALSSEQDLIAIYSTAIQGLKSDCALPFNSATDYLSTKMSWVTRVARDESQIRYALDLITAFVNKRETGEALLPRLRSIALIDIMVELKSSLEGLLETVWMVGIQDTTKEFEVRRRGLLVYLHIVKALCLLRQPLAYTAIERVLEILPLSNLDPAFVDEAARGFAVIAEGKTKGSHLTAKKMWNFVLPKLIQGDKDAEGRGRLVYLIAFSSLLPLVPASLCLADLPTILPLLLRSLSLPSPVQRINSILTLTSLLETENMSKEVDFLLHAKAEDVVDGLMKSAFVDPSGEMASSGRVRSEALRCLSCVPDVIRIESLQLHKPRIVRELGKALDDPLRGVRKEAVDCRARWYRYGSAI